MIKRIPKILMTKIIKIKRNNINLKINKNQISLKINNNLIKIIKNLYKIKN